MDKLRILLTNNTLRRWGGSERVVLDLANQFRRMGHVPVAYSSDLGAVAQELRNKGVAVLGDLRDAGFVPDIIHGQHHLDAMTAMTRFPDVPAVYACHGWAPWEETPPVFANLCGYIAVSELTAEKIRTTRGVMAPHVSVIPNPVDLRTFQPHPVNPRPLRALIFSHYVGDGPHRGSIEQACKAAGIHTVDVLGDAAGTTTASPEQLLATYDLVFGIGRSAIESAACGCAVVVVNQQGLAGFLGLEQVQAWGRHNFAPPVQQRSPLTVEALVAEIRKYDMAVIQQVCQQVRAQHDAERVAERYVEQYRRAIAIWTERSPKLIESDPRLEQLSRYLWTIAPHVKSVEATQARLARSESRVRELSHALESAGLGISAHESRS